MNYFAEAVGSMLEGLADQERKQLYLFVLFADTQPDNTRAGRSRGCDGLWMLQSRTRLAMWTLRACGRQRRSGITTSRASCEFLLPPYLYPPSALAPSISVVGRDMRVHSTRPWQQSP